MNSGRMLELGSRKKDNMNFIYGRKNVRFWITRLPNLAPIEMNF